MTVQLFCCRCSRRCADFRLLFWMGYRGKWRLAAAATIRDIALGEPNWPPPALQAGNSFSNQFELPVLFYVVIILAWITRKADLVFVVLAWIFVLARIGQAYVHNTSNQVPCAARSTGSARSLCS